MLSQISDNKINGQFEYKTDSHLATLTYRLKSNIMYLMHTSVPAELQGQGIASKLAKEALTTARNEELKIVVWCPFVSGYIERNPEWKELI